jgi:hypothetical protein
MNQPRVVITKTYSLKLQVYIIAIIGLRKKIFRRNFLAKIIYAFRVSHLRSRWLGYCNQVECFVQY